MNSQKQGKLPVNTAAPTLTKKELRHRILSIVNMRRRVGEVALWRASAPRFLPWDAMVAELIVLDQEQKLRREVIAPGNIIIHAVENLPAKKPQLKLSKQPTKRKATQRSAATKKSR